MFPIDVAVAGIPIRVHTNDIRIAEYFMTNDFLGHILPGYHIPSTPQRVKQHVYFMNGAKVPRVIRLNNHLLCYYTDILSSIHHLSYVLLYCIQKNLQISGKYYVHGAALVVNGNGLLFIGDSMAGKTTLTIRLEKECGAKIFSDDGTILSIYDGQAWLTYGNPLITMRRTDDARFHFSESMSQYVMRNPYTFSPHDPPPLIKIVYIRPHCVDKRRYGVSERSLRELYERLSVDIAALGYYQIKDQLIYKSHDNHNLARHRLLSVQKLTENIDVHEVQGSYSYITSEIMKILREAEL